MKNPILLACLLIAAIVQAQQPFQYPVAKTVDVTDNYFGTVVSDPYRWLENIKDSSVIEWFQAQADFTNQHLAKIPGQQTLISEFKNYETMRSAEYAPRGKTGKRYFYEKRLPGEQVFKLYYRDGEKGKETLLFDPQKYVPGKTYQYSTDVNDDGSLVLLNLSEAGSELGDIRILDIATRKFLPDIIPHSDGGFAEGSNTDIIYTQPKSYDTHDPENLLNVPCKLHVLGTPVTKDLVLVSSKKNPELHILPNETPYVIVSKNSPYMLLGKFNVERNQILYYALKSELKNNKIHWKPLTTKEDEVRSVTARGKDLYLLTTKGNPKFRLIKTSLDNPNLQTAQTIIEGNDEWQLSPALSQIKDYLILRQSKNELIVKSILYELSTGRITELKVPFEGNIYAGGLSKESNEMLIFNLGWTVPYNMYSYDPQIQKLSNGIFYTKFRYPNIENIVYEEIEIPSHDGVLVPLSIVYDKTKLKKDGSNIAFMEGYGSYGSNSYSPFFDPGSLTLLNRGVVLAYAHVRGGGEKGNSWYLAGKKTTKPNTWKDFNACAEYLVKNKYTSSGKFGISGGSAGGILIGRAITERPDLYKVAIPKVGCLNTLRMEFSPNGPGNIPEFGTVKDETEFKALLEMDAYQHTKKGEKYPAQLVTTGFNDPRVESYIPAKFAAKMQAANASENPVFLYVDYQAGHFGGSTIDEQFAQIAKEYAFLLWQCGHPEFRVK